MKLFLPLLALTLIVVLRAPIPAAAQTAAPTPLSAPAATSQAEKVITVKVALESSPAGAKLPAEATVTLYALAGQSPLYAREAKTDAAGTAQFSALPYQDGYGFGIVAKVGLTTYLSELITPASGASEVRVPVRIYPTTADASQLRVSQAFVLAEAPSAGKLDLINLYILSNDGDTTVEGGLKDADGKPATLTFPLPAGAQGVEFEGDDGTNFARIEDGFLTRPGIPPGEASGRVLVRYSLPYSDSLRLQSKLAYPTDKLTVFVATQGITLTSPLLNSLGNQAREDGVTMAVWGAEKLAANQGVTYDLTGQAQLATQALSHPAPQAQAAPVEADLLSGRSPKELLGIGLIAVGLLVGLAATGWWLYRSRFAPDPPERQERALLAALADLEEDHEAGRVEPQDYEQRRVLLTEALSTLTATAPLPQPEG